METLSLDGKTYYYNTKEQQLYYDKQGKRRLLDCLLTYPEMCQYREFLNGHTLTLKRLHEFTALHNCLNHYNLTGYQIHEYFQQDKRRTKQMYFLTDEKGVSLTGHWEYLELNHFIMGYGKGIATAIKNAAL